MAATVEEEGNKISCFPTAKKPRTGRWSKQSVGYLQQKHGEKSLGIVCNWKSNCNHPFTSAGIGQVSYFLETKATEETEIADQ